MIALADFIYSRSLYQDTTNNMADLLATSFSSSSSYTNPPQFAVSETTSICKQTSIIEAVTKFHLFPKLAPELRELIWEHALPAGHHGNHMVLVRLDMDYIKRGMGAMKLTIDKDTNQLHSMVQSVFDLTLSATSRESRSVYLPVCSRTLSLEKGIIHFAPSTLFHIDNILSLFISREFERYSTDWEFVKGILHAIDNLAMPSNILLRLVSNAKDFTFYTEAPRKPWIEFLVSFKSLIVFETKSRCTVMASKLYPTTEQKLAAVVRNLKEYRSKPGSLEPIPEVRAIESK
ncbi:hypothetical protein BDZ45DRAFT_755232 [Acephala macrosclerotiorum]|nr:hypothetical protein BDZ45DRAFT_755232 [Acephala macrosclerotiorum]